MSGANMEWHAPAPSPDAGTQRGRDSFERFVRRWLESFDSLRVEREQVVERDDDSRRRRSPDGTGRASGLRVEARLAHVWTVANGRAVRWEAIPDAEAALADGS
jgi:ketosteroid isomerase-like protein